MIITEAKQEYGWVGVYFDLWMERYLRMWVRKNVDTSVKDVDEHHITIKYGIKEKDHGTVLDILRKDPSIVVSFQETKMFEGPESDILYLSVNSQDCVRMNKMLENLLDHERTQPEYIPHCTLAYVQKGTAEKYTGVQIFEPEYRLQFGQATFTDMNGRKTTIRL